MIIPASSMLFCKQDKGEKETKSGFKMIKEEEVDTAEVLRVGRLVDDYAPGDHIVYKNYTTTEINLDGEEYFLIDQIDVLGKRDNE